MFKSTLSKHATGLGPNPSCIIIYYETEIEKKYIGKFQTWKLQTNKF